MKYDVNKIADLLTDDPDIFNEMAVTTGGIAMGMGNVPRSRKKKAKKVKGEDDDESQKDSQYRANPLTGKPEKNGKPAGEVLFDGEESEENTSE